MAQRSTRREFIRDLGIGAASLPFILTLAEPRLRESAEAQQRLVVLFSPNGIVPSTFWPDEAGNRSPSRRARARWSRSASRP